MSKTRKILTIMSLNFLETIDLLDDCNIIYNMLVKIYNTIKSG